MLGGDTGGVGMNWSLVVGILVLLGMVLPFIYLAVRVLREVLE